MVHEKTIKNIFPNGQVTLPAAARKAIGVRIRADVVISEGADERGPYVQITLPTQVCVFCGDPQTVPFGPKAIPVCSFCMKAAAEIVGGREEGGAACG